jgi:asparagine synthase (glutamine-hydrolysing)
MCGINGIFAYHGAADPVSRDELLKSRDHMATRGPDGAGDWFSTDGHVALGHRRLSIIDLSPAGAQPMTTADGRLVVSFNGEIYNYRELRRGLEASGYRFRTQSDTEVLLHLYAAKGGAMVGDACSHLPYGTPTGASCFSPGMHTASSHSTTPTTAEYSDLPAKLRR